MTPDEVIKKLKAQGVNITMRTLQRWVKDELIPAPERGSYGQGGGTWADYPDETVSEALTAYVLKDIHNLRNSEIAKAKKSFTEGKQTVYGAMYGIYLKMFNNQYPLEEVLETALVNRDNLF